MTDDVERKSKPQFLPWFLVILLIAAIAWIGWRTYGPNRMGDPIGTTLVSFEKQNRLVVFTAEFAPVVASKDSRFFGALKSRQVAVIPARVDYSVDLSKMDRSRLSWNAETQTMGPPITKPQQLVRSMMGHRRQRERQILKILAEAPRSLPQFIPIMYKGLDPRLEKAAQLSVHAHLIDLEHRSLVTRSGDRWAAL